MNYDLCLHIDSNEPAILKLVLKNAANYIKGLPGQRFQLVVVANGPAVTHFTRKNEEFRAMARSAFRTRSCASGSLQTDLRCKQTKA